MWGANLGRRAFRFSQPADFDPKLIRSPSVIHVHKDFGRFVANKRDLFIEGMQAEASKELEA